MSPFERFDTWMAEAIASEPRVPDALQIATVGPDGRPSLRTVLLKAWGPEGFVFYTNLGSRKAQDLRTNTAIAATLHWKSRERQVHIEGDAHPVADATADAYFASRSRGSQLGAWASRQSEVLDSPGTLSARVDEVTSRFDGQPVPRPAFWSGFRIEPTQIEFWQGRPDRLHDRDVYTRRGDAWDLSRRYP